MINIIEQIVDDIFDESFETLENIDLETFEIFKDFYKYDLITEQQIKEIINNDIKIHKKYISLFNIKKKIKCLQNDNSFNLQKFENHYINLVLAILDKNLRIIYEYVKQKRINILLTYNTYYNQIENNYLINAKDKLMNTLIFYNNNFTIS